MMCYVVHCNQILFVMDLLGIVMSVCVLSLQGLPLTASQSRLCCRVEVGVLVSSLIAVEHSSQIPTLYLGAGEHDFSASRRCSTLC